MCDKMDEYLKVGIKGAKQIAHIYAKSNPSMYDEYLEIAYFGLVKAFNSFDDSKNIKFITYSSKCMHNEILMYFRKEKKHEKNVRLFEPSTINDKGDELTYEDVLSNGVDIEGDVIAKFLKELIDDNIDTIFRTELQKKVFLIRRTGLYNQREVADQVDKSRSYISRIYNQIDDRLIIFLKKKGYDIK